MNLGMWGPPAQVLYLSKHTLRLQIEGQNREKPQKEVSLVTLDENIILNNEPHHKRRQWI